MMTNKQPAVKKKNVTNGFSLLIFLFGIGALIISFSLIREDVMSTAHTMLYYFPTQFGVTPVSDMTGGIIVGLFFTFTQVASLAAAMTKEFSKKNRIVGAVLFLVFMIADNWTDIVYRSNSFTGNIWITILVTGTIYTMGSEFSSGIASSIISHYWRSAIAEIFMGVATAKNKIGLLGKEWSRYDKAAGKKENAWIEENIDENYSSNPSLRREGFPQPAMDSRNKPGGQTSSSLSYGGRQNNPNYRMKSPMDDEE